MNKLVLFLFGMFIIAGVVASEVQQEVTATVVQPEAAYIYKSTGKINYKVIGLLEDLGYGVTLIKDTAIPSDLAGYNLVFLGDEKFSKEEEIKVHELNAIVFNHYQADEWGLTDDDGASQLGSSSPLTVLINGASFQVYTKAFSVGKVAVPYYYLDYQNKAEDLIQIAATQSNLGDVISYAETGATLENGEIVEGKICFFGIVKSEFWTEKAEELFKDCVGFVAN